MASVKALSSCQGIAQLPMQSEVWGRINNSLAVIYCLKTDRVHQPIVPCGLHGNLGSLSFKHRRHRAFLLSGMDKCHMRNGFLDLDNVSHVTQGIQFSPLHFSVIIISMQYLVAVSPTSVTSWEKLLEALGILS